MGTLKQKIMLPMQILTTIIQWGIVIVQINSANSDEYNTLKVIPHDTDAFTQGLTYFDGKLYESTGLYGRSQVRELNLENGNVVKKKQ